MFYFNKNKKFMITNVKLKVKAKQILSIRIFRINYILDVMYKLRLKKEPC